ncbi:hypothetical protein MKX01_001534, partial [Papaver californicum]
VESEVYEYGKQITPGAVRSTNWSFLCNLELLVDIYGIYIKHVLLYLNFSLPGIMMIYVNELK